MDYHPLKYIYKAAGKSALNTLLLLHGTGGDENDLLGLTHFFGTDINILSLRGNVSEAGMPRFFKRLGIGVFDENDLRFRTDEMVAFIKEVSIKENFDINKVVALGYSNGANIAASTLVMHPGFLAGAILYRSMQPFKTMPEAKGNDTPIFMSNGNMDGTIDPAATTRFVTHLKGSGFDVTDKQLPTGHQLTQQDINLSVEWFHKNFN